jgi:hypothetical protein
MAADLEEFVALMPFARQLGIALDEASADRVVARLDWAPNGAASPISSRSAQAGEELAQVVL